MPKLFLIETKGDRALIEASSTDEALAEYFADVVEGKVPLERIGNIVVLRDGRDEYPMRTVPLLWKIGLLNKEEAVSSLANMLEVTKSEAEELLERCGRADSHLIPLIKEAMARRNRQRQGFSS